MQKYGMKNGRLIILFVLAMIFLAGALQVPALGNDWRCDGKIVSTGDRLFEVLARCGEPTFRTVRYEKRIRRDLLRELFPPDGYRESEKYREPLYVEELVEIEEWMYNRGSTQFLRFLTFENGILVQIETGDYGY